MINIVSVGSAESFEAFNQEIGARKDATILTSTSGSEAVDILSEKNVDLVVIDEVLTDMAGIDLARRIAAAYPMTSVALVSPLAEEEFHEATEGLGILAQLPAAPTAADSRRLLETLARIQRLSGGMTVQTAQRKAEVDR